MRASEDKNPKKTGLEKKGEGLVGKQNALDRSHLAGEHVPVRAELERHHDPRHHSESERHAEDLQPEFEHHPIRRTTRREIPSLEYGQPRRGADRERWEDDVKRDGERELKPRQKSIEALLLEAAAARQRDQPAASPRTAGMTRHMSLGGGERRHFLISDTNPFHRALTTALSPCSVTRR